MEQLSSIVNITWNPSSANENQDVCSAAKSLPQMETEDTVDLVKGI